jgi:hypothetical protein
MGKVFSVASWNVEHFKMDTDPDRDRVHRVARFVAGNDGGPSAVPDIFALYEVEGKDVYQDFMNEFPDHRFHMTEGEETQELFVGVHRDFQTFTTQRLEFKTGRAQQRPGLLLAVRAAGADYALLFLHIKSGSNTEDFGLRDAALMHAFNLKQALDNASGGKANFIFMGDLNTMGIDDPVPRSRKMNLSSEDEIARIASWAKQRKMALLDKEKTRINDSDKEVTWYNGSRGYEPTNLDHVLASEHLQIRSQGSGPSKISILGWPKLAKADWSSWFTQYSDHALLYFEVWD